MLLFQGAVSTNPISSLKIDLWRILKSCYFLTKVGFLSASHVDEVPIVV